MNETQVTIVGNLTHEPVVRRTRSGDPFVTLRVAANERRRDGDGGYVDGHTSYYGVTCFRSLALNARATLSKGSRVIVTGRLRVTEWTSGDKRGTSVEIDAHALGPDLTWAHGELTRGTASAPSVDDRLAQEEARSALDSLEGRVDLATGELLDDGDLGADGLDPADFRRPSELLAAAAQGV